MEDFISFRRMVTPTVIQLLFWLGVAVCVIGGFIMLVGGAVLMGIAYIILGPIIVRIYCELLIVIFRINDTLTDILYALRPPGEAPMQ
jgi:hypothetical protein